MYVCMYVYDLTMRELVADPTTMTGQLDEVRIWSVARSPEEIALQVCVCVCVCTLYVVCVFTYYMLCVCVRKKECVRVYIHIICCVCVCVHVTCAHR